MKPQTLQLVQETERPGPCEVPASSRPLGDLVRVLEREAAILRELRGALERQCANVAANDVAAVDASVGDLGRLLLALEETRRHGRATLERLTGNADVPLDAVVGACGECGSPRAAEFAAARAALRRAAEETAHAAAVNRAVLRRALEAGDSFLQALFSSAADPSPAYGPGERRTSLWRVPRPGAPGLFLNRRA